MAGAEQIWPEALRTLEKRQQFALATVVNVRGSTPREVGAKMIVRSDGQFGTIGGGCGEAEVFRKARLLLDEGEGARLTEVDLTGDFDQQEIGTCGGIMDVLIEIWSPDRDLPLAHKLAEASEQNRPAALLSVVDAGTLATISVGERASIDPVQTSSDKLALGLSPVALRQLHERAADGIPGLLELDGADSLRPVSRIAPNGSTRLFIDPIAGAQRLIIAGAGHIAQPLASLGSMLGFHVTVIDDRTQFANRDRFPTADQLLVKSFRTAIDSLWLDRHCYVISVTRGHAFDDEVVRAALRQAQRDPGIFIGMIGSRRRVKTTLERIAEDGFDSALLEQIHAPLGVDLGAETPEEIAVSIMGEVIRERRTRVRDDFNMGVKLGQLKRSAGIRGQPHTRPEQPQPTPSSAATASK
ncbi:MAG: XdhC family protein [Candidatus Binataceae bacterium]|nr:XdhC family protein [Candidatus Binataceae bacterium]